MSYKVEIKELSHNRFEQNKGWVFCNITPLPEEEGEVYTIFLQRPDALELAASHKMRLALERIAAPAESPDVFFLQDIARAVLATVKGKED